MPLEPQLLGDFGASKIAALACRGPITMLITETVSAMNKAFSFSLLSFFS